jgi:RNA polymerase sigma-70 factor (ECF subfamily)
LNEFSARVQELIPRLRRYARALTGERNAADDLVQDTLERAWNKLHLWRHGSDLRAWLFTIMHNVHVNQVRSRAAGATVLLDDEAADAPVRATQSDMLEVRDIDTALLRLSIEQREVLLLVALERMSYGETARTLGIPIGTVMSRLARGRERLRALLAAESTVASLKVVK